MLLNLFERENRKEVIIETDDYQDLTWFAIDKERGIKRLADWTLVKCPLEVQAVQETESNSDEESEDIIKAREDYLSVIGKEVPNNKKNDLERITTKVKETLTPAE